MELFKIDRGTDKRYGHYQYAFYPFEKAAIAKGLERERHKRLMKIETIRNHPKNEGQVKYQVQIEILEAEVRSFDEIIEEFSN